MERLPKTRISVCMATYNGEQFVQKQLKSILIQLSVEDEVVISDDQSTDRTIELIRQMGDERIRLLEGFRFGSAMRNFENAIKNANGQFILLADQDDIWMPNKVDTILRLLKTHDLVLADCQVVNKEGQILHPSFFKIRASRPGFWRNLYRNAYVGCCMAFRREILNYALPFPNGIHMHDWWIGLLVELKGSVCFYPQPLIQYVRHGNNASPTADGSDYGIIERIQNRAFLLYSLIRRWFTF